MTIQKSTLRYEAWLAGRIRMIPGDLKLKHEAMAGAVFPFFRATFYRWMQLWPKLCADLEKTPKVLAVGDLHVENFGTWRDVEGRLVWGINDFDEAASLPYALDLVRLAASAHLAIDAAHLKIGHQEACEIILGGYRAAIAGSGSAFVLAEKHEWLRGMVSGVLRDPVQFWTKFDALKTLRSAPSSAARKALERMMPEKNLPYRLVHRIAGLGSLGRERYVAIADFHGARIAREAKALAPSAALWSGAVTSKTIRYQEMLDQPLRCADPFVKLKEKWIVRRLAPDCSRVELASMPAVRDETKLLHAMGFETANVHLGSAKSVKAIRRDLAKRPKNWLHEAAAKMSDAVRKDWAEWKK